MRAPTSALKPEEQQLRHIIEQLPAVLWTTDSDLRFTSSMGSGLSELQLQPGEINGRQNQHHEKSKKHKK
ncbi:MAG: hypothetical protein AAB354_07355, partial [candidate division KSB1 bacterium]